MLTRIFTMFARSFVWLFETQDARGRIPDISVAPDRESFARAHNNLLGQNARRASEVSRFV